ncbi:MAG: MFS transporter, partial [Ruthenibacterium sp.]
VPNTSMQFYKFLYYFILYSVFDTIWTVVFIPYNSLLAHMTDDYDERTSLNGWRVSIANMGMILGSALFPLFADGAQSFFYQIFGNEKDAYFFSSLIFGIIAGVLMFVCAFKVQERPCVAQAPRVAPWKTLKEFFSMKEFRSTLLHYTSAMTGIDVVMGIYIFYLSDVVGITNGVLLMLFLSIPLITATIAAPLWVRLSARYSKHRMYIISAGGIVIALLSTLFIPKNGYLSLFSFCIMSGFFMAALQILPFAAIPDVVEVDEYNHGVRREGSYFGVVQFSYNIASGIAMAFVSLILGVFGYVENVSGIEVVVQPESALLAVRGVLAFLPSILFLLAACFSCQINMNREKFNDMKKEIARRRE